MYANIYETTDVVVVEILPTDFAAFKFGIENASQHFLVNVVTLNTNERATEYHSNQNLLRWNQIMVIMNDYWQKIWNLLWFTSSFAPFGMKHMSDAVDE